MASSRPVLASAGLGTAALLLSACAAATPTAAPTSAASAAPPSPTPAALTTDARACAGAQAVLGHIAADTASWSPERRPFDRGVATRLRMRGTELAQQAEIADTVPVRRAVRVAGGAFTNMSAAMSTRHRAAVQAAIGGTRAAYARLKQLCAYD